MGLGNLLCVVFQLWTPHRIHQAGYNLALKAAPNYRGPAVRTTSLCCWEKQTYKHDYVVCMYMYMYVCI